MTSTAEVSVTEAYKAALRVAGYVADPMQLAAVEVLQRLATELTQYRQQRRSVLLRLWHKPQAPKSVYLWGGVGRGKSFLMDCFFDALVDVAKRRVHFHAFMQEVHFMLRGLHNTPDTLQKVADKLASQAEILCFDEFHISNIADAMILGRLLELLFERGIVFVLTSNYPPNGLYPNGLQRVNFLPTIELLNAKCQVVEIDAGVDYRLQTLADMDLYLVPLNGPNTARLGSSFFALSGVEAVPGEMTLLDRQIAYLGQHSGVIWFDFLAICDGPRSQNDYLEIAREHHAVLLSGIPKMESRDSAKARRLTWLIDVLYDFRVKFIATAEVAAPELYVEGPLDNEFQRSVSRLIEMRSHEYLALGHRDS